MDWERFKIPIGDWAEAVVDWLTALASGPVVQR